MNQVVDNVYRSNGLVYRLNRSNKKMIRGGTQFEIPIMYADLINGGFYSGYDVLDISPNDTVFNAAWDWKQAYVPVTFDGLTLMKVDSPRAVLDVVKYQFAQAELRLAEVLGVGVWSSGTNAKSVDGVQFAVDDGTEGASATYGGINRNTYPFWNCQIDAATTATGLPALQNLFGKASEGGRTPTVIFSRQANYDFYWALHTTNQRYPVEPAGHDVQLAQAGFSNLVFNGTPWLVDSHCQASHVYMLNEDYWILGVHPRADIYMEDFQVALNQDAISAKMFWGGNLMCTNPSRQAKFTALTS